MQGSTGSIGISPLAQRSFWKASILRFSRNRAPTIALLILLSVVLVSFGASWISVSILHTSPTNQNLLNNLKPWFSDGHILGTDELGRDVLSRSLYAGQISLTIAFSVALLQLTIGVTLGLLAGYYGGLVDDGVNALLQIMRGIPIFFLLIALSVLFRPSLFRLIIVLSLLGWTGTCRQVRGLVFSIKQRTYVEAAHALGANNSRILVHHVLPNVSSIVLVIAGLDIASIVITESSLSFLGFGVQAPIPSWGNMLSSALDNISVAPWLIVAPGAFITLTVFCVFLVADGLRDALDPQLVA